MTEETKVEQLSEQVDTIKELVIEERKENKEKKTKPQTFRSVQYSQHVFWVHFAGTGVLCSRKAEGIQKLKELYPGEYEVLDIMPYTPKKYNDNK